jgi:hypothetical protein
VSSLGFHTTALPAIHAGHGCVCGRDHADDAARLVVHVALPVLEEVEVDLARGEDARGTAHVVSREVRAHHQLVHERFLFRLPALATEHVDQLFGAVHQHVREAQHARAALVERERREGGLCAPRHLDCCAYVVCSRNRKAAERLTAGAA